MSLNRLSWLRPSSSFLNSAATSPDARWVLFRSGQPLIDGATLVQVTTPDIAHLLDPTPVFGQTQHDGEVGPEGFKPLAASRLRGPCVVFLGWREPEPLRPASEYKRPLTGADLPGTPYFALALDDVPEEEVARLVGHWTFAEARSAGASMDAWDTALLAVARSMLDWNARMKVCAMYFRS